jgi:hypothetical protein
MALRRNTLGALLRQRRVALDQARLDLAASLEAETAAAARVRCIAESIERETELAGRLDAGDAAVDLFAAWLRRVRVEETAAATVLQHAEQQTHEARAVLAACRGAVLVAEEAIRALVETERRAAERAEQHLIDEIGVRPRGQKR